MERSAELKELMLRIYKVFEGTDMSLLDKHISKKNGTLVIGTDAIEWWFGHETIMQKFKAQSEHFTGKIVDADPQAYVSGDVGWVADKVRVVLSTGDEIPDFRWTNVFHKEDGEWKIVQSHCSIGIPNEEAGFGDIEL